MKHHSALKKAGKNADFHLHLAQVQPGSQLPTNQLQTFRHKARKGNMRSSLCWGYYSRLPL